MGTYKSHVEEINVKNKVWNYYCDNLVKEKKLETKNILIDKKNWNDLVIYFTRYVHNKSKKTLGLHYHKLMEKIEEHEGKKYG